jgi:hypothetical protein
MTVDDVKARVRDVRAYMRDNDPDSATSAAEELYLDVLRYIASGRVPSGNGARALAREAIKAHNVKVPMHRRGVE